jgi:hypothetical protein
MKTVYIFIISILLSGCILLNNDLRPPLMNNDSFMNFQTYENQNLIYGSNYNYA